MLPTVATSPRVPGSIKATTKAAPYVHPHAGFESVLERRRVELAAEARRLARRRLIAEGVARRSVENGRGLREEDSAVICGRARRRSNRLSLVFHRAIESLWEAGGFTEALDIFREHKAELTRRVARA